MIPFSQKEVKKNIINLSLIESTVTRMEKNPVCISCSRFHVKHSFANASTQPKMHGVPS